MKFRFIHAADIHLGSPFKGLKKIPSIIRRQIADSTYIAFDRMIQWAIKHQADFIVLSGDIFDTSHRSIQAQLYFKKGMDKLCQAGITCYVIHGNHDPLDGEFHKLGLPPNVIVFPSHQVGMEIFYKNGEELAHIYGISYDTAKVSRNLAPLFTRSNQHVFSIGLLHTNCEGAQEHENYAPCSKQDLLQAGLDYWALGHVHQRRIIHQHPYIVYPGNLQGRHIREQEEKGFYVVDIDHNQVQHIHFQPVQQFIWIERTIDLTDTETIDDFLHKLDREKEALQQEFQGQGVIVRLKGLGSTTLASQLMDSDFTQSIMDSLQELNNIDVSGSSTVWIESFRFAGAPAYQRDDLLYSPGIFQDILQQVDQMLESEFIDDDHWIQITKELLEHYRVRQMLEPFSVEEQKEIVRQAEALLLNEWMGGRRA